MNESLISKRVIPDHRGGSILSALMRWESFIFLVLVVVFIINSLASPYFLDPWSLSDATFNFTEKALIALPMALLIIAREIDISVASIVALCSVVMGLLAQAGFAVPVLVIGGIVVGAACGAFNGLLVTMFRIPSIVVTIGTMSLFRGIGYIILGDGALREYPEAFAFFGQGYVFWVISFELALFILMAAVFYVLLHHTNFGRYTYAIGNNPTGAYYSGIRVDRHRLILFTLVGVLSGVASVLLTSRLGSTRPSIALTWELSVITMVVLGGVSILGGKGSILGVVIAVILMGMLTFGLGLLNIPGIVMTIIIGSMLVAVVSIPVIVERIRYLKAL